MMEYAILIVLLSVWGTRHSTALSLPCEQQFCLHGEWDPIQCKCTDTGCSPRLWCSPPHFLNEFTCKCDCGNICPYPKIPDRATCQCKCPSCPFPKTADENCWCKCPTKCPSPKFLDKSTCTCKCLTQLCPEGQVFNQSICKCQSVICLKLCPFDKTLNLRTCECE